MTVPTAFCATMGSDKNNNSMYNKDIIKNIALLKPDLERLNNGFDSIVINLNENFKTVVKNPSGSVATNVSLCAKLISYSAALEGDYYIGVTTPVNSHRTYKATSANTVEWASILSQYEVDKGAQAVIEWYVEFDDAGSFTIDGIYLVNS